jgi:hypothetical protein
MSDEQRPRAALRPEHAFVVQFSPATQADAGQMEGRVEHLVSRHATRFRSLEELLAFISRVLREVHDADSMAESCPLGGGDGRGLSEAWCGRPCGPSPSGQQSSDGPEPGRPRSESARRAVGEGRHGCS